MSVAGGRWRVRQWDPPAIVEELLVEDVTGNCHSVRGAKRALKQLLSTAKWK